MSRRELIDVAVVGAGVVGATAALALARAGLDVALIESRAPTAWQPHRPDLRVYAFAPDNAALLDTLGLWKGIRETRAQAYRRMRVWDAAGGDELAFDADAFGRSELGWIVEHGLLVDRLWHALPGAGIRLHCPDDVVGLVQDGQSATLEMASGLHLRARLVVAADGAGSAVRTMAGMDTTAHDYGQQALVAYIRTGQPHEATCWQRFLPTGPLAVLPFRDGVGACDDANAQRSSIVWTLPTEEAGRLLSVDDDVFLRELDSAFALRLGRTLEVSARATFALQRQLATSYVRGRVLLVGDAAHVVHPLAGQGVNLGLRDVAALAQTLQHTRAGENLSAARLARWARQRRSENALSAYAFEGLNRAFSNDAFAPTLLRGAALGLAGRVPALRHAFWRHAAGV